MNKSILLPLSFAVLISGCGPSIREQEMKAEVMQLRADLKQKHIRLTHLQEELGQNEIMHVRLQKNINQKKHLLNQIGDRLESVDEERENVMAYVEKERKKQMALLVGWKHLFHNQYSELEEQLARAHQELAHARKARKQKEYQTPKSGVEPRRIGRTQPPPTKE